MIFYEGHKVYMSGKYPAIFIGGKNIHVHIIEWENHFGPVPKGHIIHHKDGNKLNWDIDNLELLSRRDHIYKHMDLINRSKHKIKITARKNGVKLEFNSIKEAAKGTNQTTGGVQAVLIGRCKTSKGWIFERG